MSAGQHVPTARPPRVVPTDCSQPVTPHISPATVTRMSAWTAVLLQIVRGLSRTFLCHGPWNGTWGNHSLAGAPWCGWILTVTWGPITASLWPWKRSSRCRGQPQGLNCEPFCWPWHLRVVQSQVTKTTGTFCMARTEELCVWPMGLVQGDLKGDCQNRGGGGGIGGHAHHGAPHEGREGTNDTSGVIYK